MDIELQKALAKAVTKTEGYEKTILRIKLKEEGGGSIEYNQSGVWIDPNANFVSQYQANITDEELVRAYLLTKLVSAYGYLASPEILEIESGDWGRIFTFDISQIEAG